jgi:hypothetical protein
VQKWGEIGAYVYIMVGKHIGCDLGQGEGTYGGGKREQ